MSSYKQMKAIDHIQILQEHVEAVSKAYRSFSAQTSELNFDFFIKKLDEVEKYAAEMKKLSRFCWEVEE